MSERVTLKTEDGVTLAGDYYPASGERGVLLLHMMPVDRTSWVAFAQKLQEAGFQALAIDLRGHGESEGGPAGYKNFSDAEHQGSRADLAAGAAFLKEKGVKELHLGGASIGANLALEYLEAHPEALSAILLSPGLEYRGISIRGLVSRVSSGQGVYGVASEDDRYSWETVQELFREITLGNLRKTKFFKDAGHGTTIFERQPEFMDELVEWLDKI